ncbi:MAG: ribosomal protein S18-alanine N-acetyltransferase, partial [Bryobacteraceae bacterium]
SEPYADDRIERLSFVSDVRPLYVETNLVIVPTRVSAGTNLKVLEAMAMERAVISTTSGCAGLGLEHGKNVWIADTPEDFAQGVITLLGDAGLRSAIARAALDHARRHFDWKRLGTLQHELWNSLLKRPTVTVRKGALSDLDQVESIQKTCSGASQWDPASYLVYDLTVAETGGRIAGFIVSRRTGEDEIEILNIAVDERFRRRGVATCLIESCPTPHVFLEVRKSNTEAQGLYRKLGFAEVGVRREYYDEPLEDAIVMRLSRSGNHAKV